MTKLSHLLNNIKGCIPYYTKVNYFDGTTKNAENVAIGDKLLGYNENTKSFIEVEVLNVITVSKNQLVKVITENHEIEITTDHPLLTDKGWAVYDLEIENSNTFEKIQLDTSLKLLTKENVYENILSIELEELKESIDVYTFDTSNGIDSYVANGLVSHNYGDKDDYYIYIQPNNLSSVTVTVTTAFDSESTTNGTVSGDYFVCTSPSGYEPIQIEVVSSGYNTYVGLPEKDSSNRYYITLTAAAQNISKLSIDGNTYEIKDATARTSINNLATVATSGSYNDLSNKPTIPTVNNATLTIQKNGTTVNTFTANASSNVTANITVPTNTNELTNGAGFITGITSSDITTALGYTPYNSSNPNGYQANVIETVKVNGTALTPSSKAVNISVPTTTSSVTSGSTAALTSGGAYTNLVRRYSTSSATGSSTQGVYVNASGQIQPCTAVTSTYSSTGTAPVNGKAIANAIATKQNTLVSGTNIKTVGGTSLLGSGNIALPGVATASTAGLVKPDGTTITVDANGTISSASSVDIDEETITKNSNDELQVIAVKNKRDNSTLPIWQGTEQQWNNGVPTTWYRWETSKAAMWTSGGSLPSYTVSWYSVTYGDSKFVAVAGGESDSNKAAYSTDGINWIASTLPFVAIDGAYNSNKAAYSTDGINWIASTLPSSAYWRSVTYGDGKFVAVVYGSNKAAYSTDGINWSEIALPSSTYWYSITYGDSKFVAVAGGESDSNKAAYSTDGINWIASTLPHIQPTV